MTVRFALPSDVAAEQEEGNAFRPRFGPDGLLTAVVVDERTGHVVMLAHMNAEALERTLETGETWFWSRSRRALWHKGATSGAVQRVREIRVDCDQDAVLVTVAISHPDDTCHTGRPGCFYRRVERSAGGWMLAPAASPTSGQDEPA